jgi:galactose oxidase-like protein
MASTAIWHELGPPARIGHAAVYDAARDRLLIFGGGDPWPRADVWALDLASPVRWVQIVPDGAGPTGRSGHTTIYDPVQDRVLLFGGNDGTDRADVWELPLGATPPTWTQLTPAGAAPPPRSGHTAIYDAVGERMIVFGGSFKNDVWALSLSGLPRWSEVRPLGAPPSGRTEHTAIYDPMRRQMVIFGGRQSNGGHPTDTWTLSLSGTPAWTQLSPTGTVPRGRHKHAALYDGGADRMVILGGTSNNYDVEWEVHALSLSGTPHWEQETPWSIFDMASAYDTLRNRLLTHGGYFDQIGRMTAATYAIATTGGTGGGSVHVPVHPSQGYDRACIWDPSAQRLIVHGGSIYGGIDPGATWETVALHTTEQPPAWHDYYDYPLPDARHGHTAVHDPVANAMIVFGGDRYYTYDPLYNDTWSLGLNAGGGWTELQPGGTPPAKRWNHSAIYDPVRQRMIVFGGTSRSFFDIGTLFNDVHVLDLRPAPVWSQLQPLGTPPSPRKGHVAIYDPVGDRMLVFGGDADGPMNDLWELSFGLYPHWTQLGPSGTPPSRRAGHVAFYDPAEHRMIVQGGTTARDLWQLSLTGIEEWSRIQTSGRALPGYWEHAAVYDPTSQRAYFFGGSSSPGTWVLDLGSTVGVEEPSLQLPGFSLAGARPNPATGGLTVAFALPDATPATLELFDLAGRRLASRAVGPLGPGSHRMMLAAPGSIPVGVYLIRLTRGATSLTTKAAIVG